MAKVCSIEAGQLSPEDKARYDAVRGKKGVSVHSARQASVAAMMREATSEHRQIIAEVQRNYPDLVNGDGVFFEDLEAQRFEDEAQGEMFEARQRRSKRTAKGGGQSTAGVGIVKGAEGETKSKTGDKKQSPARVVAEEQTKDSKPAATRNPLSNKPEPAGESTRQQGADPKVEAKAEAERIRREEQEQAKREEQRAADLAAEAKAKAAAPKDTAELDDAITILEAPRNKREWREAVHTVLTVVLATIRSDNNLKDYDRAKAMVNNVGPDAELLWADDKRMETLKIFQDVVDMELRSKNAEVNDPKFSKHKKVWAFAINNGIFPAVLANLGRVKIFKGNKQGTRGVHPTDPSAAMIELVPSLGTTGKVRQSTPLPNDEAAKKAMDDAAKAEAAMFSARENKSEETEVEEDWDSGTEDILNDYAAGPGFDNDGNAKIFDNDGKPITKPISHGNAKLWVSNIMQKFNKAVRPLARVYKNVEQMKRKDPELYAKATASRKDKKPIPNNAAGYAFGDTILIFSDNIATKKQLNFTVAHEVIGHFGLGAIMPEKNFTKLLDEVYESDPAIKQEADLMMETRGLSKHEATEEAMADAAAHMETSLVARIYNAIKTFLNKLGVSFKDDMTRYFIHHSRRYQRTGQTPDSSPYAVFREFKHMQGIAGRASTAHAQTAQAAASAASNMKSAPKRLRDFLKSTTRLADARSGIGTKFQHAGRTMGKVLENVQSMSNIALRSRPMKELFGLLTMQKQHLETLKTELNDIMAWSHSYSYYDAAKTLVTGAKNTDPNRPPEKWEKELANKARVVVNRAMEMKATEGSLEGAKSLMYTDPATGELVADKRPLAWKTENGKRVVDKEKSGGFEYNRHLAKMSIKEINAGIKVQLIDDQGRPAVERNAKDEIIYYDKAGKVTTEMNLDGKPMGKPKPITEHIKLDKKVDERVYRLMEDARLATDTIALHVYTDKVKGIMDDKQVEFAEMRATNKGILSDEDMAMLNKIEELYSKLYSEGAKMEGSGMKWKADSIKRANNFLHSAVRLFDDEGAKHKINDWVNGPGEFKTVNGKKVSNDDFKNMADFISATGREDTKWAKSDKGKAFRAEMQPIIDGTIKLAENRKGKGVADTGKIKRAIQDMYLLDTQLTNAELYAKNTIQTAYVPIRRRGKIQVRVQAYTVDKDGNPLEAVRISPEQQAQMWYSRTDSQSTADSTVESLNKVLKGHKPVTIKDDEKNDVTVVFRAEWSDAPQGASLAGSISYDDLANTLVRAGINISPQDREKLVQLTASEHSTARHNLQKDWTPGWDEDVARGLAEHLEQHAHIAAKNLVQFKVNRLMINSKKGIDQWEGDPRKLKAYQDAFRILHKADKNQAAIYEAYKEMAAYQHQFVASSPKSEITIYKQDGNSVVVKGKGQGASYFKRATDIVNGYNRTQGAPATGEEQFEQYGSFAMSGTAVMHLGGAIAPALVNMVSLVTHTTTYLSTFNPKTGYGGGHGMMAATNAVRKAGSDLSLIKALRKMNDPSGSAKSLQKLIDDGTYKDHNLTLDEVEMLRDLTAEGVLTPNMYNQLSDVARHGREDAVLTRLADAWMTPFAKTEQYNRRVTALASYRLDKQRMLDASGKKTLSAKEKQALHDRATDAVNYSQGNYDSFNRPSWAQGSVFKYMWMYKQFQVITVELMRNLGHKEMYIMLGMLVIASGLKGVPFGDDLMDLVDTLLQKFGLKWAGLEAEMSLALEAAGVPSALVFRGALDYYLGVTMSTRLGMGDLVPGTGMFKAGAEMDRELEAIIGPVYGAWFGSSGAVNSMTTALQYVAEVVGVKDDVTSLSDVLRTGGGFSAVKNYAKGFITLMDGSITNERGQVVAKDAGLKDVISQLIGFYPGSATDQYAVIRMTNDARNYAQAIKSAWVDAYLKADSASERASIRKDVREWNRDSKGTMFYIKDFSGATSRAKRAATLTASGRNLQTVPKSMQGFGKDLMTARGFSPKGIPLE
jgi:hypothetical protein